MNNLSMKVRAAMLVVVLALAASIGAQQASASVVVVGNCAPGIHFSDIQTAINAVPAGSIVKVCPGEYPTQLTITKNLTVTGLLSGTSDAVVLTSPAGGLTQTASSLTSSNPIDAHIAIVGSVASQPTVNLNNLVVDSLNNGVGCPSSGGTNVVGILYQSANGIANHVTTRNQIADTQPNGCQGGLGFFAQTPSDGSVTATVTLENSSVHDYNKTGVQGSGANLTLNVINNSVTGAGPTSVTAQNGIEIAFGATGKISGNNVSGDRYTGPSYSASGILFYDAATGSASTPVISNRVMQTDLGIVFVFDGNGTDMDDNYPVKTNNVAQSTYEGIYVCANGNSITSNRVFNSGESGVDLDETCSATGNSLSQNLLVEACAGVLGDDGVNTIGAGSYFNDTYTKLNSATCPPPMAAASTNNSMAAAAMRPSSTLKAKALKRRPVNPSAP